MAIVLAMAACTIPDFTQLQTPKFDTSAFAPANFNEFMQQDRGRSVDSAQLVDADGRCANMAPVQPPDIAGGQSAQPAPSAARGIGLEMTECEVVRAAGLAQNVQIGANARGERMVVMTYTGGDRPGVYRFVDGRLVSIERGAEPPAPPPAPAKKRPAKKQTG